MKKEKLTKFNVDNPLGWSEADFRKREKMSKIIITEREFDVLELIAQGDSNKEICDKLGIAYSTLKTHLNNIYLKTFNENIKMYGESVIRVRLVLKFQNNEFEKKIYYRKNRNLQGDKK